MSKISLFGSIFVFTLLTLDGGGTLIKFCSGFLNLLHKNYPTIANPATLTPLIYISNYYLVLQVCVLPYHLLLQSVHSNS